MSKSSILGPKDRPPLSRWIPLSIQHVFAMFGATVLVPLLMWVVFYKFLAVNIPMGILSPIKDMIDMI